jgi:hypothetical protein
MSDPTKSERFFGTVEIKEQCGVDDCTEPADVVYPINTPEEGPGVWWFCVEHAMQFQEHVIDETPATVRGFAGLKQITRTCGQAFSHGQRCGALATHVAILGFRDEQGRARLGIVSVCARHAGQRGER